MNAICFSFGLISDIQHADVDDRISVSGRRRYYREALNAVERAVHDWNKETLKFVIHCGDITDGLNHKIGQSKQALNRVLQKLAPLRVSLKHVLGNHCTSQLGRKTLLQSLNFEGLKGFYEFVPRSGWRCVVLDTCDVSLYAWPQNHPHYKQAFQIMKKKNPNENWCDASTMEGMDKRFVAYNGGLGEEQLKWLDDQLEMARRQKEYVLVFTHIPISPEVAKPNALCWNYEAVMKKLSAHSDIVKAVFSGHTHRWAHVQDEHGIHHVIVPGVIEEKPGGRAHASVHVYNDRLILCGFHFEGPYSLDL